MENKDNPFLSDKINRRQTVNTYIETRDFGNIKGKGGWQKLAIFRYSLV